MSISLGVGGTILASSFLADMLLGKFFGYKQSNRELALKEKMYEIERTGLKTQASRARREEKRMDDLFRQALKFREREKEDAILMQVIQNLQSNAQRKSDMTSRMIMGAY